MAGMIEKFEEGDEDAMFMLNNFTWIFIPVTNPDGYSYTWRKDRLWRKNRRVQRYCFGVDLNRNFDIEFPGASHIFICMAYQDYREYCENDFRGAHAFSEAETKNVRHLVGLVQPNLLAYVGIHSYAQLVIAPWGWTMERPKGSEELDRVGGLLAETMSRYGANYNFGVGETVIGYPYHGASADWVLSIVPWAYTYFFELRPDIDSFRSFVLPPSEIVPCGQEVYASFVTLSREIKDRRHLFK
ncbi:zinc carboxypeptidase A 1-like [Pomacea canaliculata]|uniref:zinc carboxypeptidase A 1-like n=1 Tax=Pomacea canaliculata TaxID=400727 RepID=UPI000D72687D|nr:zinc carboxypeptidase A 1-like [Pomacea canaliculata]